MGEKVRESSRNMYKGHVDKAKGCKFEVGRQGWLGWRREW